MVATPLSNSLFSLRLRRASVVCGSAGIIVGSTALLGWILDNELLKGSFVAGITMKTNAALCVTLTGVLVVLLGLGDAQKGWGPRWLGQACAALVVSIGLATLAEHLLAVDLGIDELLFREPAGAVATTSPNRMGPIASLCLSLLGLGRLLADVRVHGERAPFQYLALAITLITSVPLLGYLFDARALFSLGKYTSIALPTAVALWLLALGLLFAQPEVGLMRRLIAEDSGAILLRRLLPAAVVVPVLLMWARLLGQELGLYDQVVGRALVVIGFVVVFTAVVWRTGDVVFRQATGAARAQQVLHEQLVQSLDALADVDRRKTEFLAVLAHELRNPLAPVRSAVHLLRARDGADAQAARTYAVIERQIAHLARLIDDLMDVSRISQDKLELRVAPVRLSELVASAVDASRYLIDAQHHRVSITLPEQEVQLEADAARLVQVFTNLLTNAARYTPPHGEIALHAQLEPAAGSDGSEPERRQLVVSVRDNGVGIGPEELPRVFDMFYQAGTDGSRGRHGLGIGLGLVRKLVELHGGSVSAVSAGSGQGSTFVVRFPAAAVSVAPSVAPAEPGPSLPAFGRLSVLVVEDNRDSAEMLSDLLQVAGAEVHVAPDGESALALGEQVQPRVILLDIGLPGISGYEVAREVRRSSWGEQVLIVALTGWGSTQDRVRSKQAGIDRHMVKPVNPDLLLALIAEFRSGVRASAGVAASPALRERFDNV
jgi:signal transduction histidine kinase/ActR/RegA family two-component response regulator